MTHQPRDATVRQDLSPAVLSQTTALSPVLSTGPLSRPETQPTQQLSQWRPTLALRSLQQRFGSKNICRISGVTSRTIQRVTSPELDWVGTVEDLRRTTSPTLCPGAFCVRPKLPSTPRQDSASCVWWRNTTSCSNLEMPHLTCGLSSSATAGIKWGTYWENRESESESQMQSFYVVFNFTFSL